MTRTTGTRAGSEPLTRRAALFGGLAGLAGGPLFAAACGVPPAGGRVAEPSTGPVTVRAFIGGIDAATMERWEGEIAAPYRQQRPNVTLELNAQSTVAPSGATAEVMEKLTALIAGGDPPDISDLPRTAAQLVSLGFLDDQTDGLVKRDKYDTKQFNQREFERRAVYQGKVWQIPFKYLSNALVAACNRALFEAEGVPLPSTDPSRLPGSWEWNAFVDTLNRLTKRPGGTTTQFGLANWGSVTYTWPLLWQADWLSADGKTVTCDSTDMQDCYTKWTELLHRHRVIPRPGEAQELFGTGTVSRLFFTGKAAMVVVSPGTWGTYITRGELPDIALAPMPKAKISTPDIASSALGIVRGSKKQADAWEAIKYLAEGSRLALFSRYVPAILKDIEPWARQDLQKYPQADARVVLKALETHVPNSTLSGHRRQDDILRVTGPALDDLLAGKEAAVPLLKRLKPELQAIVDRP